MHTTGQIEAIGTEKYLPNLQVTILIKKNVAGFQITMNNVGWVEELERSQDLVDKVLDVLGEKLLSWTDNTWQVRFHELAYEVNVAKHLSIIEVTTMSLCVFCGSEKID